MVHESVEKLEKLKSQGKVDFKLEYIELTDDMSTKERVKAQAHNNKVFAVYKANHEEAVKAENKTNDFQREK